MRAPIDNPLPRHTPPPAPKLRGGPASPQPPEPGPGQPPQPTPHMHRGQPNPKPPTGNPPPPPTPGRLLALVGTGLMVGSGLAGVALQVVAR